MRAWREALRRHWPEYLMEAALLGTFMLSALGFTALLEHPGSPLRAALPDAFVRRVLMGLAMGGTAVALVHSPWGKQSGAHFNPALTFAFFRLGKIAAPDAVGYALAQFAGAVAGVALAAALLGSAAGHPLVRFAVTEPGGPGVAVAFAAELAISFGLMLTVLVVSNHPRLAPWTGLAAGALVALYITIEAPLSGMSMNPARTLGSASGAGSFAALWVYFTAPPLGMFLAAELFVRARGAGRVHCAKLHHRNARRCIFRCGYAAS
jgi:aquaporin Z